MVSLLVVNLSQLNTVIMTNEFHKRVQLPYEATHEKDILLNTLLTGLHRSGSHI